MGAEGKLAQRDLDQLVALLHGDLPPHARPALEARLASDPSLADHYAAMQRCRRALHSAAGDEPPALSQRELETRLHWRLANEAPRPVRRPWRTAAAAAAACAAAAALIVAIARPDNGTTEPPTPTPTPPGAVTATRSPRQPKATELAALPLLLTGKVHVAPPRGPMARMELNRPVLPGDRLLTERRSRVALQWQAGSGLTLLPSSELQLLELSSAVQRIALHRGRINLRAGKHDNRLVFEVQAGPLRARVLGTHFSAWITPTNAGVEVFDGIVLASDADQPARAMLLLPGQRMHFRLPDGAMRMELIGTTPHNDYLLSDYPDLSHALATTGTLDLGDLPPHTRLQLDTLQFRGPRIRLRAGTGRHRLALLRGHSEVAVQWVQLAAATAQKVRLQVTPPGPRAVEPNALPSEGTANSIYEVFRRQTPLIQACYRKALRRKPTLQGKIILRFRIRAEGSVESVALVANLDEAPEVGRCARAMAAQWRFPSTKQPAVVTYPVLFRNR